MIKIYNLLNIPIYGDVLYQNSNLTLNEFETILTVLVILI